MADPAPSALILKIEEANLNGFPCRMSRLDGRWIARLSPGNPAKRVNSLNILDPGDHACAAERLAAAQALFVRHGVPFNLRWTPLTPNPVVAVIDALGWERHGETEVWTAPVGPALAAAPAAEGYVLREEPLGAWLEAFAAVGGTRPETVTPTAIAQLGLALSAVAPRLLRLVARGEDGCPAGVAVAVVDGGLIGLFDVAVDPEHRRRGLGRLMVTHCLGTAASEGCTLAWLQVVEDNLAAKRLYRAAGFSRAYCYHYRRPPLGRLTS